MASGDTLDFQASVVDHADLVGTWSVADNSIIKYENGKFQTLEEGTTTISYNVNGYEDKTVITVKKNQFTVENESYAIDSLIDTWNYYYEEAEFSSARLREPVGMVHNFMLYAKTMFLRESSLWSGNGFVMDITTVVEGKTEYSPLEAGRYLLDESKGGYCDYVIDWKKNSSWINLKEENSYFSVRIFNSVYEITWSGKDDNNCSLYYLGKIVRDVQSLGLDE